MTNKNHEKAETYKKSIQREFITYNVGTIPINNYCMQKNYGQQNRFHHN